MEDAGMDSYMLVGSLLIVGVASKVALAVMTASPSTTPWKPRRTRRHRRFARSLSMALVTHADDLVVQSIPQAPASTLRAS